MMMMMNDTNDMFMRFGSLIATIMFFRAMYEQYLPYQWREAIHSYLFRYTEKIVRIFSPYLHITFEEYTGEWFDRSKAYTMIETYLSERTSKKARGLKASSVEEGKALVLGIADNEEVADEFEGVKVWWNSCKHFSRTQTITYFPGADEKRYYRLTFHGRHRKLITESYLKHVLDQGKEITIKKRHRKLYTNIKQEGNYRTGGSLWSHVDFKHPATFDTLAMEPKRKQSIIDDLLRFSEAKDYYTKVGKPWKRGYLLFGPPGTGKSTMVAAMANLLEYDVYDLELTSVKDNTELRRLLIETTNKSMIVIEDIDCSLDLTGQRSHKKEGGKDDGEKSKEEEEKDEVKKKLKELQGERKKPSEVTLSGLLNFIDGIWSACGDERLIVFTTNYVDKLDPALIRRGRMDVHIELSYCCYEAFKVLAKNYLDVESHRLFARVRSLLEETKLAPADVAESLMPKSLELDVEASLESLIEELEKSRENDRLKAEEEEKEKEKARLKEEEGNAEENKTNEKAGKDEAVSSKQEEN